MLDNLRESASQSPFFKEEPTPPEETPPSPRQKPRTPGSFLGLTPVQRFVVALMVFMMVCVFGSFILLVTQKIWLGG